MATQTFDNDGQARAVTKDDLVPGNILRMVFADVSAHPFSDCVIVKVTILPILSVQDMSTVELARPYACIFGAETACPSVLMGYVNFTVYVESLVSKDSRWRVCLRSTGKAHSYLRQEPVPTNTI